MAKKRKRTLDDEEHDDEEEQHKDDDEELKAVFVDTNLDTHIVVLVSSLVTFSTLKERIVKEHYKCFSNFGQIKINSLKVKREQNYYHLSESMLLRTAFIGVETWFVFADVERGGNQVKERKCDDSKTLESEKSLMRHRTSRKKRRNDPDSDNVCEKSSLPTNLQKVAVDVDLSNVLSSKAVETSPGSEARKTEMKYGHHDTAGHALDASSASGDAKRAVEEPYQKAKKKKKRGKGLDIAMEKESTALKVTDDSKLPLSHREAVNEEDVLLKSSELKKNIESGNEEDVRAVDGSRVNSIRDEVTGLDSSKNAPEEKITESGTVAKKKKTRKSKKSGKEDAQTSQSVDVNKSEQNPEIRTEAMDCVPRAEETKKTNEVTVVAVDGSVVNGIHDEVAGLDSEKKTSEEKVTESGTIKKKRKHKSKKSDQVLSNSRQEDAQTSQSVDAINPEQNPEIRTEARDCVPRAEEPERTNEVTVDVVDGSVVNSIHDEVTGLDSEKMTRKRELSEEKTSEEKVTESGTVKKKKHKSKKSDQVLSNSKQEDAQMSQSVDVSKPEQNPEIRTEARDCVPRAEETERTNEVTVNAIDGSVVNSIHDVVTGLESEKKTSEEKVTESGTVKKKKTHKSKKSDQVLSNSKQEDVQTSQSVDVNKPEQNPEIRTEARDCVPRAEETERTNEVTVDAIDGSVVNSIQDVLDSEKMACERESSRKETGEEKVTESGTIVKKKKTHKSKKSDQVLPNSKQEDVQTLQSVDVNKPEQNPEIMTEATDCVPRAGETGRTNEVTVDAVDGSVVNSIQDVLDSEKVACDRELSIKNAPDEKITESGTVKKKKTYKSKKSDQDLSNSRREEDVQMSQSVDVSKPEQNPEIRTEQKEDASEFPLEEQLHEKVKHVISPETIIADCLKEITEELNDIPATHVVSADVTEATIVDKPKPKPSKRKTKKSKDNEETSLFSPQKKIKTVNLSAETAQSSEPVKTSPKPADDCLRENSVSINDTAERSQVNLGELDETRVDKPKPSKKRTKKSKEDEVALNDDLAAETDKSSKPVAKSKRSKGKQTTTAADVPVPEPEPEVPALEQVSEEKRVVEQADEVTLNQTVNDADSRENVTLHEKSLTDDPIEATNLDNQPSSNSNAKKLDTSPNQQKSTTPKKSKASETDAQDNVQESELDTLTILQEEQPQSVEAITSVQKKLTFSANDLSEAEQLDSLPIKNGNDNATTLKDGIPLPEENHIPSQEASSSPVKPRAPAIKQKIKKNVDLDLPTPAVTRSRAAKNSSKDVMDDTHVRNNPVIPKLGKSSLIPGKSAGLFGSLYSDSSDSDNGEFGRNLSGSSTRTPDDLYSSDYSDAEDNGDVVTSQPEPIGSQCTKDIKLPDLDIQTVLRSSARYKKAKLVASQSQDGESETPDFVPDSLFSDS